MDATWNWSDQRDAGAENGKGKTGGQGPQQKGNGASQGWFRVVTRAEAAASVAGSKRAAIQAA